MARKKKDDVKEPEIAVPEVVADGVTRDVGKENPILDNDMERKPRIEGNWKKVSAGELAALEASGVLLGYDPATCEALVK